MEKQVRPILLKLTLEALKISDISNLDKRKFMQKHIYLLQAFGFDLLYDFRWDLYGPYSPELAEEAKGVLGEKKNEYDAEIKKAGFRFSEEAISKIKDFENKIGKKLQNDTALAELIASVHFANQIVDSDEKARELINKSKPHLYDRYDEAIKICHEYLNGSPQA